LANQPAQRTPAARPLVDAATGVLLTLADLVLPVECGGCGAGAAAQKAAAQKTVVQKTAAPRTGAACADCSAALRVPPGPFRPTPAPPGLPPSYALASYAGPLRELILSYKERGRRDLARPLGEALAAVVEFGWPQHAGGRQLTLTLVPVPATAAAIRARHGDHMLRLAGHAAHRLRQHGLAVRVVPALVAAPKDDATELDRYQRAAAAKAAFRLRRRVAARLRTGQLEIVIVDDVLTTGSTLAAVATTLTAAGLQPAFAATLAATQLRYPADAT
jgi:predicted amidophosphoribosyltransferase